MSFVAFILTGLLPRTTSIAESKVKLVINGSRCLLLQAGLPSKFWPYATQAFCNGVNFSMRNGDSCYNRRLKNGHFNGKVIPFGCLIDYYPTKRTYRKSKTVAKDRQNASEHADLFDEIDDYDDEVEGVDGHEPNVHIDHEGQQEQKYASVNKLLGDEIAHGDTDLPKFSPRAIPGAFLGQRLSPPMNRARPL